MELWVWLTDEKSRGKEKILWHRSCKNNLVNVFSVFNDAHHVSDTVLQYWILNQVFLDNFNFKVHLHDFSNLILIVLGEVKVDFANFYIKLWKSSYVLYFAKIPGTYSCKNVLQIFLNFIQDVKK
jgi:hypothetical protein